jgi:hypothetical protein
MVNQFANDFHVAEAMFDGKVDEYWLLHCAINVQKVDKKKQNGRC